MRARALPLLALAIVSLLAATSALAGTQPPRGKHRSAVKKAATATHGEPAATTTTTTTTRTEPARTTTTHSEPAPATTTRTEVPAAPTPTQTQIADARGKLSSLRGDGLSVTRENGTTLSCGLTTVQAAYLAAKLPLGSAVRIVCSLDGGRYQLSTIEPTQPEPARTAPATTTTTTTQPQTADARGKVSSLRGDGLSVTRENGSTVGCGFAPAQAASLAASYPLGTPVLIVCSLEGGYYRLSTITRVT